MKLGVAYQILCELRPILEREGILDASGDFHEPSAEVWARIAGEVEDVLKAHGVVVQENVDKIIHALPLLLALAGVK